MTTKRADRRATVPQGGVGRRVLAGALLALSLGSFALVAWSMWEGAPPEIVVSLGKPKACLLYGIVGLLGAYYFATGWRHTRRDWLRFVGRLTLLTFSLAVSLVAAEIAVRTYLRHTQGFNSLQQLKAHRDGEPIRMTQPTALAAIVRISMNKMLVYELVPGLEFDFGHKMVRINRHGMRESRDYTTERRPRTRRILGIGDSGMFGWNVEQDENYLAVLEQNLAQAAGPDVYEVLNYGIPGYNTRQEVELLRHRGLAFQPDIVIVGWCDNDVSPPFFAYRQKEFNRRDMSYLYTFAFFRDDPSIAPEVARLRDIDTDLVDPALLSGSGVEGVRAAFRELQALGRDHGFKIVIFGPLRPPIVALCTELGLNYINTLALIPPDTYPAEYAIHAMHPRPEGHAILAELLEQALRKWGWLDL